MRMIKKICTYAFGTILCRLIMYILLPIYTSNFSVSVYGEASMSLSTANIITSLVFMEVWSAFMRFGYEQQGEEYRSLFSSTILIVLILTPLFIGITTVTSLLLMLSYVPLMITYGLSLTLMNIEQYLCRIKGRQKLFIAAGILSAVLQLVLAFVLLRCNALESSSILLLPTLGNVAGGMLIFVFTHQDQQIDFRKVHRNEIDKLVRFSFPLSLNSVAFWGMTNIGSYIARARLGIVANGYISVANKFTAIILLVVSVYDLAWQETAFEHANDSKREALYSSELCRFMDVMCLVSIEAILGIDIIFPYYIGDSYAVSRMLLPIYLCGSFINSISTFVGVIYSVAKKNNILTWSTVFGCVVSIITVLCTIDGLGVICVPIALVLGMMVNTLFRFLLMKKRIHIQIRIDTCSLVLAVTLLVSACILTYITQSIVLKSLFGLVVLLSYLYKYRNSIKGIVSMVSNH